MTKIRKKQQRQKKTTRFGRKQRCILLFLPPENSSSSSTVLFPFGTRDEKQTEQNDLANLFAAPIRPCAQFCLTYCESTHCLTTHSAIRHLQQQVLLCQLCSITGNGACCSHTAGRSPPKLKVSRWRAADIIWQILKDVYWLWLRAACGKMLAGDDSFLRNVLLKLIKALFLLLQIADLIILNYAVFTSCLTREALRGRSARCLLVLKRSKVAMGVEQDN